MVSPLILVPVLLLLPWPGLAEKCRECSILGNIAEYYCPRDGYPETHIYCCGPGIQNHCCPQPSPDYAEYASNLTVGECNQLPFILLFLGIVTGSIICCCCLPLLCC